MIWTAGWNIRTLGIDYASQLGARLSPGGLVKYRPWIFNKFVGDAGAAGTLPCWPQLIPNCPLLSVMVPTGPVSSSFLSCFLLPQGLCACCILGLACSPSFSLIYSLKSHLRMPSWEKMLQTRSRTLLSYSHCSKYLSIRVIITVIILYLLVSFLINVYRLHWNVSCLRGDNMPVLLIVLHCVPGTVSQSFTTP